MVAARWTKLGSVTVNKRLSRSAECEKCIPYRSTPSLTLPLIHPPTSHTPLMNLLGRILLFCAHYVSFRTKACLYQSNCQTKLVIVIQELSQLFWHFINALAHYLGLCLLLLKSMYYTLNINVTRFSGKLSSINLSNALFYFWHCA